MQKQFTIDVSLHTALFDHAMKTRNTVTGIVREIIEDFFKLSEPDREIIMRKNHTIGTVQLFSVNLPDELCKKLNKYLVEVGMKPQRFIMNVVSEWKHKQKVS